MEEGNLVTRTFCLILDRLVYRIYWQDKWKKSVIYWIVSAPDKETQPVTLSSITSALSALQEEAFHPDKEVQAMQWSCSDCPNKENELDRGFD